MATPRKNWERDEQELFLELYCANRRRGSGKGDSRIAAQKAAIPPAKRYSEGTLLGSNIPEYVLQQIAVIEKKHVDETSQPWIPPAKEVAQEVVHPIKAAMAMAVQAPDRVAVAEHRYERTVGTIMEELVLAIRREVRAEMLAEIHTAIDVNFQNVLDYLTDPEHKIDGRITMDEIRKRGKIVIVGLLNAQAEIIKKEFPRFRITNIEANHTGSKLASAAVKADRVIVMRDWVSHDADSILKKNNVPYEWCSGTMTALRAKLNAVAVL